MAKRNMFEPVATPFGNVRSSSPPRWMLTPVDRLNDDLFTRNAEIDRVGKAR